MVLKSIGVLSCGKIMGILYAIMGLIGGLFFSFISILGTLAEQGDKPPVVVMLGIGIAAAVMVPVFYGILGFIGGVIMAAVYNLVAGTIGGLELEFEDPTYAASLPVQ